MITNLLLLPGCSRKLAALLCLAGALQGAPVATATDSPASISETLELAIYSEETRGDLDAAMQLYQQVVADSTASRALAAQALFRLGICQDKKSDYAAAIATFEKLVRDYPDEKDFVAAASDYLSGGAGLLPAPWGDSEEISYDFRVGGGMKMGFGRYQVRRDELDGKPVWEIDSLQFANQIVHSTAEAELDSMKPLHCTWSSQLMGRTETRYADGKAEITVAKAGHRSVDLPPGVIYENEECLHLIRRLPLAVGFRKTLAVFVGLAGMAVPVELSVVGTEKVEVPAGSFDCLKTELKLPGNVQTFWFSSDPHHYLVKFEVGAVSAVTTAIHSPIPAGPVAMTEPTLGYTITTPAGWIIQRDESPESAPHPSLLVMDDHGTAMTVVKVESKSHYGPEILASVRAFADNQIASSQKYTTEFTVHPDSWTETTIDGQPALSFTADHVKGAVKMLALVTVAVVGDNTVDISCYVAPDDAEAFRPKYEALVASYRDKR